MSIPAEASVLLSPSVDVSFLSAFLFSADLTTTEIIIQFRITILAILRSGETKVRWGGNNKEKIGFVILKQEVKIHSLWVNGFQTNFYMNT